MTHGSDPDAAERASCAERGVEHVIDQLVENVDGAQHSAHDSLKHEIHDHNIAQWRSALGLRMADEPGTGTSGQPNELCLRDLARVARDRARELTAATLRLLDHSTTIDTRSRARAARAVCVRDELRRTMKAHGEMMRAVGEPPERVIIEAKSVMDQAVAEVEHEAS